MNRAPLSSLCAVAAIVHCHGHKGSAMLQTVVDFIALGCFFSTSQAYVYTVPCWPIIKFLALKIRGNQCSINCMLIAVNRKMSIKIARIWYGIWYRNSSNLVRGRKIIIFAKIRTKLEFQDFWHFKILFRYSPYLKFTWKSTYIDVFEFLRVVSRCIGWSVA